MLWRKNGKEIKNWIRNGKNALLVTGARQVGKTFLIEEMLKAEKVDFVKFNLIDQPEVISLFDATAEKPSDVFLARLALLTNIELVKGQTIIFFDEIQERKDLVTKIKFLVEEGSYRYVLSGSLLGVELLDLKSAPVGYLDTIELFPLDLEEFLIALGLKRNTIDILKNSFDKLLPVDDFIHKKIMEAFRIYLVIGGMPQAVHEYITSHDYNRVLSVQNSIIPQYKKDFSKYESREKKLRLVNTYELIPAELNEKNKRYTFTHLDKNLKMDRYFDSFEWLIYSGVAIPVYNTTEPKIPLKANEKSNLFKLFLSDAGLLSAMYGKSTIIKTLNGDESINYGAVYENVIAQELKAHGYELFYFNSKKQGELDFLIEHENACLPLEIKSGKDYRIHSALNNIVSNNYFNISRAFVLCNNNLSVYDKIIYLPIYMIMFIDENSRDIPKYSAINLTQL